MVFYREGQELHLISFLKEKVTINKAVHLALTTTRFDEFVRSHRSLEGSLFRLARHSSKSKHPGRRYQTGFFPGPDGYWIEVNSVKE
jgi:hypothetical protein